MREKIVITRNELYEQVWSKPMTLLAKEYGVSDVGLSKICKKLNIPRPPVGYWSKIKAGKKVNHPYLPELDISNQETYVLENKNSPEIKSLPPDITYKLDTIKNKRIVVPQRVSKFHSLVQETKLFLSNSSNKTNGILGHKYQKCLDLRVTKNSLHRALILINTIIRECNNMNIVIKNYQHRKTVAIYEGQEIQFIIREKLKRIENPNKSDWNKYKLLPTDNLCIEIQNYYYEDYVRKSFADTTKTKVENLIGDFIQSIFILSYYENQRNKKNALEKKQKEESKKILLDKLKIIETEELNIEQLKKDAQLFEESEIIRRFVEIKKAKNRNLSSEQQHELG